MHEEDRRSYARLDEVHGKAGGDPDKASGRRKGGCRRGEDGVPERRKRENCGQQRPGHEEPHHGFINLATAAAEPAVRCQNSYFVESLGIPGPTRETTRTLE